MFADCCIKSHYVGICIFVTIFCTFAAIADSIQNIGTTKQLFIDDFIIENTSNVIRTLNQAIKSDPVIFPEHSWEGIGSNFPSTYLYGTVLREGDTFRMWYQTLADNGKYLTCYAESVNGVDWVKPLGLGIYKYNGSFQNNIVGEMAAVSVVMGGPGDDTQKKYYSYSYRDLKGFFTAVSEDGIRWNDIAVHKNFASTGGGDVCSMVWDSLKRQFVVFYKHHRDDGMQFHRDFYFATTYDLINFSAGTIMTGLADSNDSLGHLRADCYGIGVYPYEDVYIGFDWVFHIDRWPNGQGGPIDVQLVFSRNLSKPWQCPFRKPIIPLGAPGTFDGGMITTATYPIRVGDEVWLYYGGWNGEHDAPNRSGKIGIAKWRLDGFVSLNSGDSEAVVTTRRIMFSGSGLFLNADASAMNSYLLAELVDTTGMALKGFSKNDCVPIKSDGVRLPVVWHNSSKVSDLSNMPCKIKFYMKNARIYSFQFAENDTGSKGNNPIATYPEVSIFPNPFFNSISVSYKNLKENKSEIIIFSVCGKKVWSTTVFGERGTLRWDGRDLNKRFCASGMYYVRLINDRQYRICRICLLR